MRDRREIERQEERKSTRKTMGWGDGRGGGVLSLRSKWITIYSPVKVGQTVMAMLAQQPGFAVWYYL
jgi:hypothetical protein